MARQMKDSGVEWIGEIPETWDILPAKRMFCNSGETKKADDVQLTASQQYGIISQSDYMALTGSRVVLATQDLEKWKHVEPQDFIISLRSFQGGLEMSKVSGCITWHYVVLRSCHKGINARFYKWLFKSSEYITALQRTCNYIRDGQDLRYSNFEQVPLFLPKEEEQEIIANILDTKCAEIDKVVEQTRATIEEYKKLKQAIITEAVTKGVRGPRSMKPSGVEWIGDIPEGWKKVSLKYLCRMNAGDSLSSLDILPKGDYPVYGGNGLRGFYSSSNCKGPIILIGRQGALCGNVHRVDGDFWATEHAVITRFTPDIFMQYGYYLLVAMNLGQYVSPSAAQPGLSVSKISSITATIPSISEQQEIAAYLDTKCAEIDRIIEKKEQLIEELGSYKKSLIYECVTGKREIKIHNYSQGAIC